MNFNRIDKWSFRYALTRKYVSFIQNIIFYRKICIKGRENLPKNTPLFFAPNHQNALMDALVILCNIKPQPVFIARADIFKNRLIARILIFFKILPAYRIRDGKENLAKNEEIFNVSVKILENKNILALFPETTHTDKRKLQILKKGVQRIVFQAEEKNNFQLGVKIVPIGIYFSNYWNFRSDVLVNFGKPIDLKEYLEIYRDNQQKAMLLLRDRISDELKPLIIHIKNEQYYDLYEFLREVYNSRMLKKLSLTKTLYNRFIADQKTIQCLDKAIDNKPELIEELNQVSNSYKDWLNRLNIRHWVSDKNEGLISLLLKSFGMLLLLPVFLSGFLTHFIPYYIPSPLTKKLKDRQFISSINFVAAIILFPLFYLIYFVLFWLFSPIWWLKFVFLVSLPIIGLCAFGYHRWFVKLKAQWKFRFNRTIEIFNLKNKVISIMERIESGNF